MTRILPAVAALGLLAGCAQVATQAPTDALGGTSWQLVRFQGGDGTILMPDDKSKYAARSRSPARCARPDRCMTTSSSNGRSFGRTS